MAEEVESLEFGNATKRARFEYNTNADGSEYESESFPGTAEFVSGTSVSSGEGTQTSDSGFNEYTPPRSMDEDSSNNPSSSHSGAVSGIPIPSKQNDLTGDEDTNSMDSTDSDISGFSSFSNMSGKNWKPCAGSMSWVEQQVLKGVNPRNVLSQVLGGSWQVPDGISDAMLWHLIFNMLSEPPRREKLRHINTIDDVVRLIKVCKKIIVLTGAGVSVSCGIPDFRSKDGIYARLSVDFPGLPDPQAMFDINYFRQDPRPFFKFAREIYPGQFTPSLCHKFIRLIEEHNRLLRNYTQNIDTLEQVAGISNVIQCHGSFATATCQRCGHKVDASAIREEIFKQVIPKCSACIDIPTSDRGASYSTAFISPPEAQRECAEKQNGLGLLGAFTTDFLAEQHDMHSRDVPYEPVMKPDIVFFGEGLSEEFHERMTEDNEECDLLIVIGSSLKVRPVCLIPSSLPPNVPQILINREPLPHLTFDVELLGDCDVIVSELCRRLGNDWQKLSNREALTEIEELPPREESIAEMVDVKKDGKISTADTPHPKDEKDIEALRACWEPKIKESVSARLPEGNFLFSGRHRYIFAGAEVYYDPDDEEESSSDSSVDSTDEAKSRVEPVPSQEENSPQEEKFEATSPTQGPTTCSKADNSSLLESDTKCSEKVLSSSNPTSSSCEGTG